MGKLGHLLLFIEGFLTLIPTKTEKNYKNMEVRVFSGFCTVLIREISFFKKYLENYWFSKMNDFLKEDRNLVPRYGSNINLDIYQDIDNSLNIVESNNNLKSDRYHDKLLKKYNSAFKCYKLSGAHSFLLNLVCLTRSTIKAHENSSILIML